LDIARDFKLVSVEDWLAGYLGWEDVDEKSRFGSGIFAALYTLYARIAWVC